MITALYTLEKELAKAKSTLASNEEALDTLLSNLQSDDNEVRGEYNANFALLHEQSISLRQYIATLKQAIYYTQEAINCMQ